MPTATPKARKPRGMQVRLGLDGAPAWLHHSGAPVVEEQDCRISTRLLFVAALG